MRIGVYCGSFNPVHKGHIKIVRTALKKDLLDKVLIVATGNYWDKQNLPPVRDRIRMLKYFDNDKIIIDETHNDIQYTYQLFRVLKKEYPDDQLVLIIGRDNIPNFTRWKRYRELLKYDFIVIPREDIDSEDLDAMMQEMGKTNYTIMDDEEDAADPDDINAKYRDDDGHTLHFPDDAEIEKRKRNIH